MSDAVTVTEQIGWGRRLKDATGGVLFGVVLILIAFGLLWWNEGRAVRRAQALEEGAAAVVSISSEKIDPANEGRLVHLSGLATTEERLADSAFGVSAQALVLERSVEMYQWDEDEETREEKKMGGSVERTTTYTYEKKWASSAISSSDFQNPAGHQNPAMPFEDKSFTAENATLGAFRLTESIIGAIGGAEALPLGAMDTGSIGQTGAAGRHIIGNMIYLGADPNNPAIGDVRVRFTSVTPTTISVVAKQAGPTLLPYITKNGGDIELVERGSVPADAMFQSAVEENTLLTWILRAVGFVLIWIGFGLIFKPLSVLADVVPFIGDLVEMGTGLVAFLIALVLSFLIIAIAWIAARPLLAIGLIAVSAASLGFLVRYAIKARAKRPAQA